MKTILRVLLSLVLCLMTTQCANLEIDVPTSNVDFPETSEKLGKEVAEELEKIVRAMHKNGADYSDIKDDTAFTKIFYEDLSKVVPSMHTKSYTDNPVFSPTVFSQGYLSLTDTQIKYIDGIIDVCAEINNYSETQARLLSLYDDIKKNVPINQQERLINVIATFYYCFDVLDHLEQAGIMLSVPNQLIPTIQTKSEMATGGSCRKILATAWAIAIGEPTPAGEIVASVMTVWYAGQLLYEVVLCKKATNSSYEENREWCISKYVDCKEHAPMNTNCDDCLQYCITQSVWPSNCNY